jgi:hypothetical protein
MTTKTVKVTRTTGGYNFDCYNFKVYNAAPPKKTGWVVWDGVRNMEQVKEAILSQPPGTAIIVASKEHPDFPYYIYRNERLLWFRLAEQKSGVRWK